jgi:hypothetical protein
MSLKITIAEETGLYPGVSGLIGEYLTKLPFCAELIRSTRFVHKDLDLDYHYCSDQNNSHGWRITRNHQIWFVQFKDFNN